MIASKAYSQSLSPDKTKHNVEVGVFYSYDQNLSGDNIALHPDIGFHTDYDKFNFTTGVTVVYFLSNNVAIHSGISYVNRNFNGTFYCNSCSFAGVSPQQEEIDVAFIQLPLLLQLYPYNNRFSIFTEIGIINQLMFGFDEPDTYGVTDRLQGNTYSISGIVGVGAGYKLSPSFVIQLSVNYTNGLSNIFGNADYDYQTVGIQLGLKRKL